MSRSKENYSSKSKLDRENMGLGLFGTSMELKIRPSVIEQKCKNVLVMDRC